MKKRPSALRTAACFIDQACEPDTPFELGVVLLPEPCVLPEPVDPPVLPGQLRPDGAVVPPEGAVVPPLSVPSVALGVGVALGSGLAAMTAATPPTPSSPTASNAVSAPRRRPATRRSAGGGAGDGAGPAACAVSSYQFIDDSCVLKVRTR
jgi:hypothetical protein